ncbi:integral membrane sensor signal transduction histidine kinase [Methylobacterium sp. 4-46]|uniref:sensor histidine kinase n=1 Tax=unclassified Methylobacterium TaxID=2615210 RepID=UPI000165C5AC|nr:MULTISPECIES: ATP-binding protein [Methylobacterium]ACA17946.1 integral membrane sensor signal transduction histidine kinase [Methylobacterium sp. 4-46]WFT77247.1 ATP-binding protein [Methylobacterium nodulans]
MRSVRRRLFWKIYLTLLASLVGAAIAMAGLWWMLGESPHKRWEALETHIAHEAVALAGPPAEAEPAVRRLSGLFGADAALYDRGGALLAARGTRAVLLGGEATGPPVRWVLRSALPDGRTLLVSIHPSPSTRIARIATLTLLVAAFVALAAFPVTARLTRRLERLRAGVARWGEGDLRARVDEGGGDEVAAVARTFNLAAGRVDALLAAQRRLLANASHELRSPLARLRMAVDLWAGRPEAARAEIVRNLGELDTLVDEILLSSRLDHAEAGLDRRETVDLLGLAAEEAARVGAEVEGVPVSVRGDPVLLRRLLRNLLENGAAHGAPPVRVRAEPSGARARLVVSDHGPGIPAAERERVFEPFYRPRGRREEAGGWGLGLSLVRQIAQRHGGLALCEGAEAGGSRFVVDLPRAP